MSSRKASGDPARARLKSLFHQARLGCPHPNSQPAVTHAVFSPKFLRQIERDKGMRRTLMADGAAVNIREMLKHQANGAELGIAEKQLSLWPTPLHSALTDVGVPSVYVPSRDEFVLLVPDEISVEETIEAGDYLILKGQACIRRGEALKTFAEQRKAIKGGA